MPNLAPARRIAAAIATLSIVTTLAFAAPAYADDEPTTPTPVVEQTTPEEVAPEDAAPQETDPEAQVVKEEAPEEEAPEEEAPSASRIADPAAALVATPVQVVQQSPANGEHLYPTDARVTLSWTDPQVGYNDYQIQGTNANPGPGDIVGAPYNYNAPKVPDARVQSYTVDGVGAGVYWWQVRAVNSTTGEAGPWSTVRKLLVGDIPVPTNVGCTTGVQPVTIAGTSQLNLSETRANGSATMTPDGLSLVWTGSNYDAKAAWYYATDFPLSQLGTPTFDYVNTGGASGVGENYSVIAREAGKADKWLGNIVREAAFYTGYWTTFDGTYGLVDPSGYASKSINDILSQMYLQHPEWTLTVVAIGGSGGSGTTGAGILHSQSAGCISLAYQGGAVPTNQECRAAATPVTIDSSSDLNLSETRLGGSSRVTTNGMTLAWHGPILSTSKVAWYWAVPSGGFPLKTLGSPTIDYTKLTGASVGENYTIAVNGAVQGNIVREPGIANFWTTFSIPGMKADPTASYRKAIGTINDFLAAYNSWDPTADVRVVAVGGSGGSGSEGTGVLHSQGAACYVLTYAATPPLAPQQVAPANNSYVASHDFPMSWNDFGTGYTYEIYSTTDPADTDTVIQNPINGGLAGLSNPYNIQGVPDATYWWQVRAIDPDGNAGAWSAIWKVTVDTTAPSVPAPVYPGGWNQSADHFQWFPATDTNPVTYELVVGNHPNLDADGRISGTVYPNISGTSFDYAFTSGPVQWQVRAKDAAGNYSAWSAPYGAQIIGTPVITAPTNNLSFNAASLLAKWTGVYGIGGVDQWEVVYGTDRDNDTVLEYTSRFVEGDQLQRLQQFTTNYQGVLTVKVRAIYNIGFNADPDSKKGPWSNTVTYYRDSVGPVAPQPFNPSNGGTFDSRTQTLEWLAVGDAVKYQVRTSTDAGTTAGQLNGGEAVTLATTTNLTQSVTAPRDGYFFWQVRAVDALGNVGPWSNVWGMELDTTAPVAPQPFNPSNGATFASRTQTLTWLAVGDAAQYQAQWSTSPSRDAEGTLDGGDLVTLAASTGLTKSVTAPADGYLFWQVRSIDAVGNVGAWSSIWAYGSDTTGPEQVVLTSPANGASVSTVGTTTFTWSAPDTSAAYILEFSLSDETDEDGYFVTPIASAPLNTNEADVSALAGTYFWHVIAFDELGNASPWSTAFTVTFATPAVPEVPVTPVTPAAPAAPAPTAAAPVAIATPAAVTPVTPTNTTPNAPADTTDNTTDELPTEAFDPQPTSGDAPWWPWALGAAILLLLAALWFFVFRRRFGNNS